MRILSLLIFVLLCGCSACSIKESANDSNMGGAPEVVMSMATPPAPAPAPYIIEERQKAEVFAAVEEKLVAPSKKHKKAKMRSVKKVADAVTSQLHMATLSFLVADTANIRDVITAQLLIQPTISEEELDKQFAGHVTTKIVVSNIATATLTSDDFAIKAITPVEQAIAETQATVWNWDLHANSAGQKHVKLSVDAVITIDNKSTQYHLRTFEQDVTITITQKQQFMAWIKQYGQWFWSTLLLPLIAFLWKRYNKTK
jgi:hypothetical protein